MNLVLHRAQVALNISDFDITDQVAEQLNKVMPTVVMPPDGAAPTAMPAAKPGVDVPAAPVLAPGPRHTP